MSWPGFFRNLKGLLQFIGELEEKDLTKALMQELVLRAHSLGKKSLQPPKIGKAND